MRKNRSGNPVLLLIGVAMIVILAVTGISIHHAVNRNVEGLSNSASTEK